MNLNRMDGECKRNLNENPLQMLSLRGKFIAAAPAVTGTGKML
jgi:hypothetical protein